MHISMSVQILWLPRNVQLSDLIFNFENVSNLKFIIPHFKIYGPINFAKAYFTDIAVHILLQ